MKSDNIMSQEHETLKIRRKITPDPFNRNTKNLDLMQNNLKIAAETIEALKQERDRMKFSVKSFNDQSPLPDSLRKSSEEAENLKKILKIKEKNIEKLEKQLRSFKLNQIDTEALADNCEKLKKELVNKEKYIISLEKIIRDLKADLLSQTISIENSDASLIDKNFIENLQKEISDLKNEKNNWSKVYKTAWSLNQDLINSQELTDTKYKKSEFVLHAFENLRALIAQKENEIKDLKTKKPKEKIRSLKDYNKTLLNEIDLLRRKTMKPSLLFELTEACTHFIQGVHSSQALYFPFKKHFSSSKSLKDLIESAFHSEALLRLLNFSLEIIQTHFLQPETPEEDSESFQYFQSQTPKSRVMWKHDQVLETRPRFYSPCSTTQGFYQQGYQQSYQPVHSPAQVYHNNQVSSLKIIQPRRSDKLVGSDKSNKSQQTSVDAKIQPGVFLRNFRENDEAGNRDLKGTVLKEKIESYGQGSGNRVEASQGKGEKDEGTGFIQIFDESEQLLNIIDKQNSRLARIGNQISQLVPEKIESVDEPSSESSDDDQKKKYHYLVTYPDQREFQEGTFGRKVSSTNPEISENSKISRSDRDNYIKILGKNDFDRNDYCSVPDLAERSKYQESKNFQSYVEPSRKEQDLKKFNPERKNLNFDCQVPRSKDFPNFSHKSNPKVSDRRPEFNQDLRTNEKDLRNNLKSYQEDLKPERNLSEYWNCVADYFSQKDDSD